MHAFPRIVGGTQRRFVRSWGLKAQERLHLTSGSLDECVRAIETSKTAVVAHVLLNLRIGVFIHSHVLALGFPTPAFGCVLPRGGVLQVPCRLWAQDQMAWMLTRYDPRLERAYPNTGTWGEVR